MPIVGGPFSSLYIGDAQATDRRSRTFRRVVSANSYLTVPASLGNHVSTPDAAALDLAGDVEMVARVAADDYSSGAEQRIISKRETAVRGNYEMYLSATGNLQFGTNPAASEGTSTVALPYGNGVACWLKITRTSSTGVVRFYHAADQVSEPTSWTQLGTDVAATSGALNVLTDQLWVGAIGTAFTPFGGKIYRAIVRNGIDGTVVADFNPNLYSTGSTFTSTDGRVYTLNGTAAITKA